MDFLKILHQLASRDKKPTWPKLCKGGLNLKLAFALKILSSELRKMQLLFNTEETTNRK